MPNVHWVFSHGWGLSPEFWQPLLALLPKGKVTVWDQGYFGDELICPSPQTGLPLLVVGHSLGFMQAVQAKLPAAGYVCLQGFTSFCPPTPNQPGVPLALVEDIRTNLLANPQQTLEHFYHTAGIDLAVPALPNVDLLLAGLDQLANNQIVWPVQPTFVITAADDPIVPASLTKQQSRGVETVTYQRLASGQHALGYTHAETILDRIEAWWAPHA